MLTIVQLRHLGGALARPAANPGAVGTVEEPYQLFVLGIPAVPELVKPLRASSTRWSGRWRRSRATAGCSTSSATTPTRRPAFTPEALERLRAIKASATRSV